MTSFFLFPLKTCYILFFLSTISSFSQSDTKAIKVRKESAVYFFQKGEERDTVSLNKSDLFYFIVPDSLKGYYSLIVDNGHLIPTKGDTLFQLKYLSGLKYECLYDRKETGSLKKNKVVWEFKTLINGTTDFETNKIRVLLINRKKDKVFLEKNFFYKN